jgi:FdhD protein
VSREAAIVPTEVAEDGTSITVTEALTADGSASADIRRLDALPSEVVSALTADGNLRSLFQRMFSMGDLRQATGGIHTGALVVGDEVRFVREDVSRHCVIDKLIGSGRRARIDPAQVLFLLSGRVSATIAAKVARAGVPVIATMSIPTTLAATIAARAGVTIIGRARSPKPHTYAPGA